MNTNQPIILSKMEWERGFKAYGALEKTYEDYVESAVKSIKWEPGMLAWNLSTQRIEKFPLTSLPKYYQPPTEEQLADYQNDPVEICEAARKAKGDEYFTEKGLGWLRGLDKLDVEPFKVGDVVSFGDTLYSVLAIGNTIIAQCKDKEGQLRQIYIDNLTHATPAQVDEFYTVNIDGVRYRFYKCSGILYATGTTMEDNKKEPMIGLSLMSFLIRALIKHHKYPVLAIDDVEDMVAPTKGEE